MRLVMRIVSFKKTAHSRILEPRDAGHVHSTGGKESTGKIFLLLLRLSIPRAQNTLDQFLINCNALRLKQDVSHSKLRSPGYACDMMAF